MDMEGVGCNHARERIMAVRTNWGMVQRSGITRILVTSLSAIVVPTLLWIVPAAAQTSAAITEPEFRCILEHAQAYRRQGDEIVLNFRTCPAEPSRVEKLEAWEAQNFFPQPTFSVEPDTEPVAPEDVPVLMISGREFDCLISHPEAIEVDAATGRFLVLPDSCRSNP
ncbi:hypothetical protein [Jannaschia sp. W003]|uniref:hypothetical protein n=1 Tax=Jannaschia sp. W003 TaxID=2867012 RepID=UPI0021A5B866|nr:hypothetical protein [Jannaschia sp. W003]UWQ23115.1 hypothetical protein K3554_16260 [Jannaschia sp. W003]